MLRSARLAPVNNVQECCFHLLQASMCAYVILIIAIYWMTEALPMASTALFPIMLFPFLGVCSSKALCKQYMKVSVRLQTLGSKSQTLSSPLQCSAMSNTPSSSFILITLLCGIDVWRYTSRSSVVHRTTSPAPQTLPSAPEPQFYNYHTVMLCSLLRMDSAE